MKKRTYLGIIESEHCALQTLVLAEDAGVARARVLDHFSRTMGRPCREDQLRVIPFGASA